MTTRRDFLKATGVLPFLGAVAGATDRTDETPRPDEQLRQLCEQGLKARYHDQPDRWQNGRLATPIQERLDRELEVIHELNLDNYFLVLQDLVQNSRNQSSPAAVEGPIVGTLVSFGLGLSHVCPLRHRLLFERFMVFGRRADPNFSIIVCNESQEEVVRYARAKYGWVDDRPYLACRQVWRSPRADTAKTLTIDIDVLWVRDLSILRNTIKQVKERGNATIDLSTLPENDPATLALFRRGDTDEIFQFWDSGIKEFLRRQQPKRFEDLAAAIAVYRSSRNDSGLAENYMAAKRDREQTHADVELEEILGETRGIVVYQEQIMEILYRLAGMTLREGMQLIKAIAMDRQEVIDKYRSRFLKGMSEREVQYDAAEKIVEAIGHAGGKASCKARAVSNAYLAYQMAYLKAHFPNEFAAACKAAPNFPSIAVEE